MEERSNKSSYSSRYKLIIIKGLFKMKTIQIPSSVSKALNIKVEAGNNKELDYFKKQYPEGFNGFKKISERLDSLLGNISEEIGEYIAGGKELTNNILLKKKHKRTEEERLEVINNLTNKDVITIITQQSKEML